MLATMRLFESLVLRDMASSHLRNSQSPSQAQDSYTHIIKERKSFNGVALRSNTFEIALNLKKSSEKGCMP